MSDTEDSSSESDREMLREALDTSMFSNQLKTTSIIKKKQGSCKDNILNVTPEFQNFVAQRLSKVLDKTFEECENEHLSFKQDQNSGIRLFSNSSRVLKDVKFHDICDQINSGKSKKKKICKRVPVLDDETYESEIQKKAKCAAVSIDWIVNKEGVKGWTKPKGIEFKYKKQSNGELKLIEPQTDFTKYT